MLSTASDDFAKRRDAARDPFERAEQLGQRTAIGHVGLNAARIERNAARADDEHLVLEPQRSNDDLNRADELADADHGRVGQRGHRRHLQLLEGLQPLAPRDRARAERVEVLGQHHRRRLGQPEEAPFALDVFERHHEDPRRRLRHRTAADGGQHQEGEDARSHDASAGATGCPFAIATFSTQVGSPVPRHATTSVRAPMSKSASSRVNAAA
jgi:hypothetical protein